MIDENRNLRGVRLCMLDGRIERYVHLAAVDNMFCLQRNDSFSAQRGMYEYMRIYICMQIQV
jgi:hypothetical protein